jgi:hypothetical protein
MMMMRRLLPSLVTIGLVVLAAGLAQAGDPKTSLGVWMQGTTGLSQAMTPADGGDGPDFGSLQAGFNKLLTKEPAAATYPNWDSLLRQGLKAAQGSDKAGVKATCKGCHDAYKKAYIADPTSAKPPASYF